MPIPTFSELSIVIAVLVALSSMPVEVNVVKVPAAADDPPITVPSIVPPLISAVAMVAPVTVRSTLTSVTVAPAPAPLNDATAFPKSHWLAIHPNCIGSSALAEQFMTC